MQNSEYNSTLVIKDLDGGSWVADLECTSNYIVNIKIAQGINNINFTADLHYFSAFEVGAHKVTSAASVEEFIFVKMNDF